MAHQSDAMIYLADQRGCTETPDCRSYHVFNSGDYFSEHRKDFGNLYGLNDTVLARKKSVIFVSNENSVLLIVPVVGSLRYQIDNTEPCSVNVGKVHVLIIEKGMKLMVENPGNDVVNFIHFWVSNGKVNENLFTEFKFDLIQNKVIPFRFNSAEGSVQVQLCIARFGGRDESVHKLKDVEKGAFVFVLEGVFEINDRLVHARDGLALWNTREIEFEALSNDAILFVVEC